MVEDGLASGASTTPDEPRSPPGAGGWVPVGVRGGRAAWSRTTRVPSDLPTTPTAEQKATKDKLEKLSGAEFDKEFTATMVRNHRANIPNFQREADKGADPDVKNFASMVLP